MASISGVEISISLDDSDSPETVKSLLAKLPFEAAAHVWGDEIYTDPSPVIESEENAKDTVLLYDVAYWPQGRAICLFYGPTPIGKKGKIQPYSPVNVIGKITNPDKKILSQADGATILFSKK